MKALAVAGWCFLILLPLAAVAQYDEKDEGPELGPERIVFQTKHGDIEFGLFPRIAPETAKHILKLARLGCYNTNHFFRVDKGFVAQVADVLGGRRLKLNEEQEAEAVKKLPGEFSSVKHQRGILSMGRYDDPNSATSSFSILLGDAPHLDGKYAVFGKVTRGLDVLSSLEQLPTRREGIFVMPLERISIASTYVYEVGTETISCDSQLDLMHRRLVQTELLASELRRKCLP